LTTKQQLFAELCGSGMPRLHAYRAAYPARSSAGRSYGTERNSAYELAKNPEIAAVISRFQQQRLEASQLAVRLFVDAAEAIVVAKNSTGHFSAAASRISSAIEAAQPVADPPAPMQAQAISSGERAELQPQLPVSESRPLSVSNTPHTAGGYWGFELIPGHFPPRRRRRWVPASE
jgi:hypothetical protein